MSELEKFQRKLDRAFRLIRSAYPVLQANDTIVPKSGENARWANRRTGTIAFANHEGTVTRCEIVGDTCSPDQTEWIANTMAGAQEMVRRVVMNKEILTSWQNRNHKRGQRGGGIEIPTLTCRYGAIAFAGLPESANECLVIESNLETGFITNTEAEIFRSFSQQDISQDLRQSVHDVCHSVWHP